MAQSEDLSNGQLPLRGVVLCCTSLPQDERTKLSDAALQMGALHKLDLTADVTHLIVGSITTAKYRYVAKDRPDIKVLQPSWMDAVRESWMEGGDVDVQALERQHQTPCFDGFQICVTGFDDIVQRNYISHTAERQGATYHGDLTKAVTHLICHKPEGAKYTAAKSWGLHVLSLKWFEDSLSRGMALDEKLYDPSKPLEEQGHGAFKRYSHERTSLGKRRSEGEGQDVSKKKLRRTASTRLESQSQDMWQDISAHSIGSRQSEADQWDDYDDTSRTHVSETSVAAPKTQKHTMKIDEDADDPAIPTGIFAGSYILIHGFERKKANLLQKYLEPNGGRVVQTSTELEDASTQPFFKKRYLLVPHTQSPPTSPLPDVPPDTQTTTEWWVERCIHYKELLDPSKDALSRPFTGNTISEFAGLSISTTGFAGVDLRQLAEAVRSMGATYQEKILPSSSILISGSKSIRREKAYYAQKHRIPVVNAEWLWACMESKRRVQFDDFLVRLPALETRDFESEASPAPSDAQQDVTKNTGKAKDPSALKRLSNTRSKQATPTLSLQAAKTKPTPAASKPWPILHEDDDASTSFDSDLLATHSDKTAVEKTFQPLQDVSPNVSPRKTSEDSHDGHGPASKADSSSKSAPRTNSPEKPASPASMKEGQAAADRVFVPPPQNLNADLAELLHRTTTSRPNSASGRSPEKRKKRPLGRAPSGISNRSNSGNLSPALPAEQEEASEADGFNTVKEAPLPPSTQLGYETAEAEAHRLRMSKKMGTKLQDDQGLTRLASVGTVKDSTIVSQAGVSGRVRAKSRGK